MRPQFCRPTPGAVPGVMTHQPSNNSGSKQAKTTAELACIQLFQTRALANPSKPTAISTATTMPAW